MTIYRRILEDTRQHFTLLGNARRTRYNSNQSSIMTGGSQQQQQKQQEYVEAWTKPYHFCSDSPGNILYVLFLSPHKNPFKARAVRPPDNVLRDSLAVPRRRRLQSAKKVVINQLCFVDMILRHEGWAGRKQVLDGSIHRIAAPTRTCIRLVDRGTRLLEQKTPLES